MSRAKMIRPWPPEPVYRAAGFAATPRPEIGVVTWNVNTTCNYRCSYCTQRFLDDRGRWLRDTPAFLDGFARLPGAWEVKLSGGEPFQHPSLDEITAGLARLDIRVSVVTNFSASRERLASFLDAAGAHLRVFSASLHLEYVDTSVRLEEFAERASWVAGRLPAEATFAITCVATRENLPLLPELASWFERRRLRFKVQPEKQDREVIDYSAEETVQLVALGGHNGTGVVRHGFSGRPCWSGARAFTLDDRGHAWRCYPARRHRAQYLGNFLDGSFVLANGPSPCLYSYCSCTVPIERGMMPL